MKTGALAMPAFMRRPTLRGRLAMLVLAVALPLVVLNLALVYAGYRQARQQAGREALNVARALALALEGELRGRTIALEVLAGSRALATGDLDTFRGQAQALVDRQAPGSNILLLEESGRQLMNTAAPPGTPLPVRAYLDNHRRVLGTGRPATSDLFFGLVVRRPVIAIDVPVPLPVPVPAGPSRMVLSMNPPLDAFDALIRRQQPGAEWIIAVIDRPGVRVARIPDAHRFVGEPVTADLMVPWQSGAPQGVLDALSPDGDHVLTAFVRLPEPYGWGVAVAVPEAALTRQALRTALGLLVAALALLGLGLLLARRISLGVLQPVTELLRFAAAPDGVDPPAASRIRVLPEADRLAEALLAEARRRRAATASLMDSERRLRLVVAELNHRAKNALATVQSLAMQTARGASGSDPEVFMQAFTGRLQSLARAHDLLTAVAWEGAALDAVVRTGLAPWLEPEGQTEGQVGGQIGEQAEGQVRPRFVLDAAAPGPMPQVPPGQVQALVMGLHELAVNALKHGALSVPDGYVEVICRADPAGFNAMVEWREVDGPPVPGEPTRRGFGTRLLERALARDLGPGSRVVLRFDPDGLRATISFAPRPVAREGAIG